MSDLLKFVRNILGFGGSEERNILQSRKRRLIQEEIENFSSKIRRLNDFKMSYNMNDEWSDFPSTSKTSFLKMGPPRRQPIRPHSMKTLHNDIIDLSDDDDDIVEITPRHTLGMMNGNSSGLESKLRSTSPRNVILEARRSIKNCNKFLNGGDLNQSIRLDEQQLYRDMLQSSCKTSAFYSNSGISTSTPTFPRKNDYQDKSDRTRKILQLLKEKNSIPVVDLTDEKCNKNNEPIVIKDDSDVDSVGSKKKIEPINSFKKVLDNEPFMNPNYLAKFEEMRIQRKKEIENEITEKRKQRDIFSNTNRENSNLLLEVRLKNCKISEVVLLDEYPEEEVSFPELSPEQEAKINEAFKSRNPSRLFADKYNLRITAHDLKTFRGLEWLNDEVINFYLNMIQERSQKDKLPKVYSFSTFFYPKLVSSGYSSLRRWTKRVDIFSHDIIVVPVHLRYHWCMAIIDFRDKSIRYYDSMLGTNMQCLNALESYLREEHKDKKKSDYDTSDWTKLIMKDIPTQMNGSDCGVFSCTFAEFITRNAKLLFTQEHMPYIRRKMVIEIIEGKLLT